MIPSDQPLPSAGGSYMRDPKTGALTEILPADAAPDERADAAADTEPGGAPALKPRKPAPKE